MQRPSPAITLLLRCFTRQMQRPSALGSERMGSSTTEFEMGALLNRALYRELSLCSILFAAEGLLSM
jgi:hypothetical protein